MKHIFPVFLLVVIFVSCNNKSENSEQTTVPAVIPSAGNAISPGNNDSLTSGLALNPQHGEPGHRCDIAVGAPLNAPVANKSADSNGTTKPVIIPTEAPKVIPTTNPATANLNPKHGEPGHRCDIAVGAPLNSKPTQ